MYPFLVTPGLDPGVHDFKAWMPGTSPGMTDERMASKRGIDRSAASLLAAEALEKPREQAGGTMGAVS
jgi:hypothetical protein